MLKIDFALAISVERCNPNGDPAGNNRPRQDIWGYGEISDVCIKRKIRNRMQDLGQNIIITPQDRTYDGLYSTSARLKSQEDLMEFSKKGDLENFKKRACEIWADVRFFGAVFAFKDKTFNTATCNIRGPVSIGIARSLEPVDIEAMWITKSINNGDDPKKGKSVTDKDSSTMGVKYLIPHGAYIAYGSISPDLAAKTGFSDNDVEMLKESLITIFENDYSANRPSGSMTSTLFWWEHTNPKICVNPAKIFRSLNICPIDKYPYYEYTPEEIKGISLTVYDESFIS